MSEQCVPALKIRSRTHQSCVVMGPIKMKSWMMFGGGGKYGRVLTAVCVVLSSVLMPISTVERFCFEIGKEVLPWESRLGHCLTAYI